MAMIEGEAEITTTTVAETAAGEDSTMGHTKVAGTVAEVATEAKAEVTITAEVVATAVKAVVITAEAVATTAEAVVITAEAVATTAEAVAITAEAVATTAEAVVTTVEAEAAITIEAAEATATKVEAITAEETTTKTTASPLEIADRARTTPALSMTSITGGSAFTTLSTEEQEPTNASASSTRTMPPNGTPMTVRGQGTGNHTVDLGNRISDNSKDTSSHLQLVFLHRQSLWHKEDHMCSSRRPISSRRLYRQVDRT